MTPKPRANDFDRKLGAKVRHYRERRGITQEGLAATIGVTFQQVQKYEKGTNRISVHRFLLIADGLGCSVATLLRGLTI
jgi:transcriptional regulator with XRE-family HTH domain